MRRRCLLVLCGLVIGSLGIPARGDAQSPPRGATPRLPILHSGSAPSPSRCAWPFIVDAADLNLAYPDPNATYWAQPFVLGSNESLLLRGSYPSSRFMAVTLYTDTGDTVQQLSDFAIEPDPGSANPFAVADPPPGTRRRWQMRVIAASSSPGGGNVLMANPGQQAGWLVYRVYLGNPAGSLQGSQPLPTIVRMRGLDATQTLAPCRTFLPGTAIADALSGALPSPVEVTGAPQFVRIANDSGLFANTANAYLTAFSDAPSGQILVVRGKLPTSPDTGAGQSVVGDFDLRYFSITSNLNQVPYPTVDGLYDYELPLDDTGYYTVVIARDGDVPSNATAAENVAVLDWGDGPSQAVIVRNMLPSSSFTMAVQSVTPSDYGAPSDAAEVMGEFYPQIATCSTATFEAAGAAGCSANSP